MMINKSEVDFDIIFGTKREWKKVKKRRRQSALLIVQDIKPKNKKSYVLKSRNKLTLKSHIKSIKNKLGTSESLKEIVNIHAKENEHFGLTLKPPEKSVSLISLKNGKSIKANPSNQVLTKPSDSTAEDANNMYMSTVQYLKHRLEEDIKKTHKWNENCWYPNPASRNAFKVFRWSTSQNKRKKYRCKNWIKTH